jgi:hypothetical protein
MRLPITFTFLRVALLVAATSLFLVAGCANRPPKPPPDPIVPLAKIALLPTLLPESASTMPRGGAGYVAPVQPMAPSAAVAMIGAGLIAYAIIDSRKKEAARLTEAVASIRFDPAASLNERLQKRLESEGVVVERVADDVARRVRESGDYKQLASQADAVLDLQIDEVGYYDAGSRRGYSPMLGVSAQLATTRTNNDPESYSYWADWKGNPKDLRSIATPPTMTYDNVPLIGANAEAARAAFEATLERMIDQLVIDVKRRVAAQPRLP